MPRNSNTFEPPSGASPARGDPLLSSSASRSTCPGEAPEGGIVFGGEDEGNVYAQGVDAGHRVAPEAQKLFVLGVVLVATFAFALVAPQDVFDFELYTSQGTGFTAAWLVRELQENASGVVALVTGQDGGPMGYKALVLRYVVIMLAGAGLALCGAVYQGSFRNALVTPTTLGVMVGSTLGLYVWVALFAIDGDTVNWVSSSLGYTQTIGNGGSILASSFGLSLFSFLGCLLVVALVLACVRLAGARSSSGIMMVIAGQVVGGALMAVCRSIRYYWDTVDPEGTVVSLLTDLQISSFYRDYSLADVVIIAVPLLVTFAAIMAIGPKIMLLTFEEGERRAMGVNGEAMRMLVILLCTALTALIISFCGRIGFVGFIVPHLARRIVGPNFRWLLPASALLGAVFVLGAHVLLLMTLGSQFENLTGTFMSIFGAAVFVVTAIGGKGSARGSFN